MSRKRFIIGACVGVAGLVLSSGVSHAKTITVQNVSQNTTTGTYVYAITFDSEAYVKPGDGFVIYGFPGLTSWTLTGSGPSGSLDASGTGTTSTGPMSLTETTPSNALTDGNAKTIADTNSATIAAENGITLDTSVDNLSFVWQGPPTIYTGDATATLTLNTSVTKGDSTSVYASVDRSGTAPGTSYGTAEGTVFVPGSGVAVPEPVGGAFLLLAGSGLIRRRRRA